MNKRQIKKRVKKWADKNPDLPFLRHFYQCVYVHKIPKETLCK